MRSVIKPHHYLRISIFFILIATNGCLRKSNVQTPPDHSHISQKSQQKTELTASVSKVSHSTPKRSALDEFIMPSTAQEIQLPSREPAPLSTAVSIDTTPQNTTIIHNLQDDDNSSNNLSKNQEEMIETTLDQKLVTINFEQEDLTSIINHIAALKGYNIILPTGADAIVQKVTFKLPYPVKLQDVDRYLDTFLELSGYSKVPHGSFYRIVKNDVNIVRESLPLYITVNAQDLPNTDERIRVVCYFKNLRVPDTNTTNEPITVILNDILSPTAKVSYDGKTNAVVIADKANSIRSALNLLFELDTIGTKDILRTITLFNTSAETIAQILNTQILAMGGGEDAASIQGDAGRYFSAHMRVIADPRMNTLLVMGREPALERLEDFIRNYLDVSSDSGKSIIHFYELQYLDAEKFAPVLQNIVSENVGSGQASKNTPTGPFHFFDGVRVVPEKIFDEAVTERTLTTAANKASDITTALKGKVYRGGNRLVITAINRDWKRIELLIHELDKPRLQIIVQVMIIDFTANMSKILGSQTRNPAWMQLPPGLNFQTAHLISPPILDGTLQPGQTPLFADPTTVAADLLRIITASPTPPATSPPAESAAGVLTQSNTDIGSTIISFTDNSPQSYGVWSFLQWLSSFGYTNVLSHPHVIVANNTRGEAESSDIRLLDGPAQTGEGGAIARKQIDVKASLKVSVVPRASSKDRLNLQISVTIEQFTSVTSQNRTTRQLHTDVNLNNGQTLLLGGLMTYTDSKTLNETPLLSKVPILKWLFSAEERGQIKSNLLLLVTPTIIEPKIRDGLEQFTRDRIHYMREHLSEEEVFSQIVDPVTYLFFDGQDNVQITTQRLDEYTAEAIGDFVFKNKKSDQLGISDHHCIPCQTQETSEKQVRENTTIPPLDNITTASIKDQLAFEDNPLASHKPRK